jgi:hypothetical protein
MVVGFVATTIRSFFDTKNILFALKIIFYKMARINYMEQKYKEFEQDFRKNNKEPKFE